MIVNSRRAGVIGGVAVASATIIFLSYYFLMTAWAYVEVGPGGHDAEIVNLTDGDMQRYPTLQRLVIEADESRGIVPSRALEQIPRTQADEIADLLKLRNEGPQAAGAFAYNDTTYGIYIFYQYNPPLLQ